MRVARLVDFDRSAVFSAKGSAGRFLHLALHRNDKSVAFSCQEETIGNYCVSLKHTLILLLWELS
jgi:hypothetical protein